MSFYSKISLLALLAAGTAIGMGIPKHNVSLPRIFARATAYSVLGMGLYHWSIFMHELGHKYTGKLLMNVPGQIEIGFGDGQTKFDWSEVNPNDVSHAKVIAMLSAGPLAGLLAGLSIYKSAKLTKQDLLLKNMFKVYGSISIFTHVMNLLPIHEASDGNKIIIFSKAWLNDEADKQKNNGSKS